MTTPRAGDTSNTQVNDVLVAANAYTDLHAGGGSSPGDMPVTANTLCLWKLDEASAPFVNSGVGGSCDLSTSGTGIYTRRSSPAGFGVYLPNVSGNVDRNLVSAATSVGEATGGVTLLVTLTTKVWSGTSGWVGKMYYPSLWTGPFLSLAIAVYGSAEGRWNADVTTVGGGSIQVTTVDYVNDATSVLVLDKPQQIAIVHDVAASRIRAYLDEAEVINVAVLAGETDWGSHGPWIVGGTPTTASGMNGIFRSVRVEKGAWTAADVAASYRRQMGLG